jgi:YjzC-like protein
MRAGPTFLAIERDQFTASPGAIFLRFPDQDGMMQQDTHVPGDPAPKSGVYAEMNVFGSPTGRRVQLQAGQELPKAPREFHWRLVEAAADDDG